MVPMNWNLTLYLDHFGLLAPLNKKDLKLTPVILARKANIWRIKVQGHPWQIVHVTPPSPK
jgi:hypothetical protein